MAMYNLIENSDYYPKASGSLSQYYRDQPHHNLTDSESFRSKTNIIGNNPADGNTKVVEIIVAIKYLSHF